MAPRITSKHMDALFIYFFLPKTIYSKLGLNLGVALPPNLVELSHLHPISVQGCPRGAHPRAAGREGVVRNQCSRCTKRKPTQLELAPGNPEARHSQGLGTVLGQGEDLNTRNTVSSTQQWGRVGDDVAQNARERGREENHLKKKNRVNLSKCHPSHTWFG